jgi:hypothetical protein
MKIACLHTLASNAAIFEAAKPDGASVSHTVRPDLLSEAERLGGMTSDVEAAAIAALLELARAADAVLLTCSTIGAAADAASRQTGAPILRADASLAREAVRAGNPVLVLCAVETTMAPSRQLFERAAAETGAAIDLALVPGAWLAFKAGDVKTYHRLVADYADEAHASGHALLALAQASMAGAVDLCRVAKPLASPQIGMAAALAAARAA